MLETISYCAKNVREQAERLRVHAEQVQATHQLLMDEAYRFCTIYSLKKPENVSEAIELANFAKKFVLGE